MKSIKSKDNLPLKMTPSCVCVLCDKKERGFSIFFSPPALNKFCAYIGLLGTTEILVFNYNKIYGEKLVLLI